MSVRPDQIEAVGQALDNDTTYISILTREQYDELMCYPQTQAEHVLSPLAPRPIDGHQSDDPSGLIRHITQSSWAMPIGLGVSDLHSSVWSPSQKMNGLLGTRFYEKTVNGRRYVIIKGNRAQRSILTGTRYRADHPKIMELAIGSKAMGKAMLKGLKVAAGVGVALEVVEWIFNDEYTAADLLGGIATEVGKAMIGTAIASVAAMLAGVVFTGVAFAPIGVFVVIGALAGWRLNVWDNNNKIKKQVQAGMVGALDWLDERTGSVGDWTQEQYESLRTAVNGAVDSYRNTLDKQIEAADRNFEDVIQRSLDNPYMANPEEIQGRAIQSSALRFARWVVGD